MSQKLENLLNLALETPESIREMTDDLNVGFDRERKRWELIVKYHGSLEKLRSLEVGVEPLIAGYAILTVPEGLVEAVAQLEEIEYVEKPKRYYYGDATEPVPFVVPGLGVESCVYPVTFRPPNLTGQGVLMAILDSGIDYLRPEFRNRDGSTRILYLWDQTLKGSQDCQASPPEGFLLGLEFDRQQIDLALSQPSPELARQLLPSIDTSGHGTAVAGIAAASDDYGDVTYTGVAPGCDLLIIKLGLPAEDGFPQTTEIMRGITYAVQKALDLEMPLVINLSFGNNYGPHDGTSLLERFLDNAAEIGRTVICVGSGNEGSSAGHAAGDAGTQAVVELSVGSYERNLSIQLWKHYRDRLRIGLRSPGGTTRFLPDTRSSEKYTLRMEQTELLVYFGEPTPYSVNQEIYLELIPAAGPYINEGIWQLSLEPMETATGPYSLYLPTAFARSQGTGFVTPTPQLTLTIPSTAAKVVTVGAYTSVYDAYADFSGRGYADLDRAMGVLLAGGIKPDLAAPGVDILAPDLYSGYLPMTGTSFATPIVSGCAALMMGWGIVRGNDPYLYGEKIKSYLHAGALPLSGEAFYPNARVGWGKLCLSRSLPLD